MHILTPTWQIQINGRSSDLDYLEQHFTSDSSRVVRDAEDGRRVYESAKFATCTDSQQVMIIARSLLETLSGILKLTRNSDQALVSGAVLRLHPNGRRDVFVGLGGTSTRIELGNLTAEETDAAGNRTNLMVQPPRTVTLAELALRDDAVAKTMRLFAAPDFNSWVGLYRVFEVIKADLGGEHAIKQKDWGSTADMNRFTRSANSVTVGGDAARHGNENSTPPPNPMILDEAIAYVTYLVQAWIAWK
jgi:hypothetical protein